MNGNGQGFEVKVHELVTARLDGFEVTTARAMASRARPTATGSLSAARCLEAHGASKAHEVKVAGSTSATATFMCL